MLNEKITIQRCNTDAIGSGLYAREQIDKGEVVWQRDGTEIIYSVDQVIAMTDEERRHVYQVGPEQYAKDTDGSSFMNHHCNPSAWYDGDDTMTARNDIPPGDEVTFAYQTGECRSEALNKMKCLCGDPNCKGIIDHTDCLDQKFQEQFEGHMTSWVTAFIKENSPQR